MRIIGLLSALPLLVTAGCAMTPQEQAAAADRSAAAERDFHRALAGLKPGETTDCLPVRGQSSLAAYGDKLVYSFTPGLAYVNETNGGCESVARGDVLVTRSIDRLCRGDIATTVDNLSHTPTGSCGLGSFTVWRK